MAAITLPDRLITIAVLFVSIVWLRGACACSSATFDVAEVNPSISTTETNPSTDTEETAKPQEVGTSDGIPFSNDGSTDASYDAKPIGLDSASDTGLVPTPGWISCDGTHCAVPYTCCQDDIDVGVVAHYCRTDPLCGYPTSRRFACDEPADCASGKCCDGSMGTTCDCAKTTRCMKASDCASGVCGIDPKWPGHGRCGV